MTMSQDLTRNRNHVRRYFDFLTCLSICLLTVSVGAVKTVFLSML